MCGWAVHAWVEFLRFGERIALLRMLNIQLSARVCNTINGMPSTVSCALFQANPLAGLICSLLGPLESRIEGVRCQWRDCQYDPAG